MKTIRYNQTFINGITMLSIVIDGRLKFIATESKKFQGGWEVMTANQEKLGWFQNITSIEEFINA